MEGLRLSALPSKMKVDSGAPETALMKQFVAWKDNLRSTARTRLRHRSAAQYQPVFASDRSFSLGLQQALTSGSLS
jgi:hypothetical protein